MENDFNDINFSDESELYDLGLEMGQCVSPP